MATKKRKRARTNARRAKGVRQVAPVRQGMTEGSSQPSRRALQGGGPLRTVFDRSFPLVSAAYRAVGVMIPSVAKVTPAVSRIASTALPKAWGVLPSRKWGRTGLPTERRLEVRPGQIGVFSFLGKVLSGPMQALELGKGLTGLVHEQTKQRGPRAALEDELLELKMRYEGGEITKQEFTKREKELKKKLKEAEEGAP